MKIKIKILTFLMLGMLYINQVNSQCSKLVRSYFNCRNNLSAGIISISIIADNILIENLISYFNQIRRNYQTTIGKVFYRATRTSTRQMGCLSRSTTT